MKPYSFEDEKQITVEDLAVIGKSHSITVEKEFTFKQLTIIGYLQHQWFKEKGLRRQQMNVLEFL